MYQRRRNRFELYITLFQLTILLLLFIIKWRGICYFYWSVISSLLRLMILMLMMLLVLLPHTPVCYYSTSIPIQILFLLFRQHNYGNNFDFKLWIIIQSIADHPSDMYSCWWCFMFSPTFDTVRLSWIKSDNTPDMGNNIILYIQTTI